MRYFLHLLNSFKKDTRGVTAIIFALALIPLIGAGGAAIDYSRAFVVQKRLGQALDAAALAMASSSLTDPQEIKDLGQTYFDANYPAQEIGAPGAIQVTINGSTIDASATAQLPTSLMGVIGLDHLDVTADTQVTKEQTAMEVVLVLDNTGSMGGSKLADLKDASNLLVDTLFGGETSHPLLKMGLVPFSASVNVGSQYENSGWIDTNKSSPLHGVNFKGNTNIFSQFNKISNKSWNGCVEARSYPMDVEDTVPVSGDGSTLWVPYFYPDEPDLYGYYHNYLGDAVSGSASKRQKHKKKYKNSSVSGSGPHMNCEIAPITPLTNSKNTISNGIDNMVANGSTVIPIGMAWGWRVISPSEPFTEGAAYNDPDNPTTKAIVLLSDGDNSIGNLSNHNKSWYNGYGFVSTQVATNRLNTTNNSQAHSELNNRLSEVCQNIKDQGVIIFTVAFQISSSSTKTLMENCASSAAYYFDASDSSKLLTAFQTIGSELGELRLSQ